MKCLCLCKLLFDVFAVFCFDEGCAICLDCLGSVYAEIKKTEAAIVGHLRTVLFVMIMLPSLDKKIIC